MFFYQIINFRSDPELIKKIGIQRFKLFPKPSELYNVLNIFGKSILTTNGEEWERHRKIAGPHFSLEKHLRQIHTSSVTHAHTLFKVWEKENFYLPVKNSLHNFTLDVIGAAAFGYELNSLKELELSEYPKEDVPEGVTTTFSKSLQTILGAALLYRILGETLLKHLPFSWSRKFYNVKIIIISIYRFVECKRF